MHSSLWIKDQTRRQNSGIFGPDHHRSSESWTQAPSGRNLTTVASGHQVEKVKIKHVSKK
jgi:hypothetical protein